MGRSLKIALERRPSTASLLDGLIPPPRGLQIEVVPVAPISKAFGRMVRDLEFDICEMALVTYFFAWAHDVPVVALPVFLAGNFPHASIQCSKESGIRGPRDLTGAQVGSRSFGLTSAVWARGMLDRQFGVDLSELTWVVAGDDHVPDIKISYPLVRLPGADLQAMLRRGEIQAGIGLGVRDDSVRSMWDDPSMFEEDWLSIVGGTPLNHTVIVRQDLFDREPDLAEELFTWFLESKRVGLEADPQAPNPYRYGMTKSNSASLTTLLELTKEQFPEETKLPTHVTEAFVTIENEPEAE